MKTMYVIAFDLSYPEGYKGEGFTSYAGEYEEDVYSSCTLSECKTFDSIDAADEFFKQNKTSLIDLCWFSVKNPRICKISIEDVKSIKF